MTRSTALAALLFLGAGCGGENASEAPRIALGTDTCAECSMKVNDAHYAAAVREASGVLVYDSIECLARARRKAGGSITDAIWIADHPTGTLHPQSTVTVVQGGYPSPMGGGLAAFVDPAQARSEADARGGMAGTLADAVSGALARRNAP